MGLHPRSRRRSSGKKGSKADEAHSELALSESKMVTVFRREDDSVYHQRCKRPLSFQGIRALLEADFYCLACMAHVTIPLPALDRIPVA